MLTLERDRERPAPARNSSSPRQSVQAFTIRTEEAVQPDAIPGGPPSAVTTNAEPSVSGSISGLLFDAAQPGETSIGSVENSIAESTEDFDSDGPTAPNSGGSNSGSSTAKFNSAPLHSRTLPLPRLHVPRAPQRVKTAQGGSPDSAQILRYLTTHSRVQSADTSPKQAPLSPPATGLATPYVAPEVDIEKLDVNFKVWMQARDGSPKREMRCEVNTAQVETVEDLKRAVLEYIQAQETNVVADKYLKGTLRLKNSAVQFADQHPTSYLLFFFLCSSPKPDLMQTYEIDVELDLHPNTFSEPKKAAYFLKPSGAFHRMAKKYFVLQHGTLYYGKDESQALDHMKHIQLSQVSFDVRDAKDRTIILEFKDSNLKMQALSDEDKAEWMAELRLLCMVSAECRQAKGDVAMRGRKAKFCATCKESFSIFRRPHVCHTCGLSFCENDFYPKDRVCKADKRESCEVSHSSLINSGPAAVREAADIAQQSGLTCSFSLLTEKDHTTKSGSPRPELAPARSPTIERLAAQAANAKPDSLAAGVLVINVIQAMGLMIADTGGSSDPYAVIYFEDKEYRTKTIMTTLNPEWKESFVINTRGAQNIVHIGVFDWDRTKKDDFLGMISIPLTALQNGKYYDKWYPLQRRPGKYGEHDKGVTGSIHIGLSYSYSIKSLFQPIIPDDVALAKRLASGEDITPELQQLQKSTAKFSFKELGYNFSRADALVKALQLDKRAKSISDILSWKSPAYTMFCLFIYLYMCAYFPARMVPALPFLLLLYVLISNLINAMFFECEIVQDGGATVLNPVLKEHQDNLKRSSSHESSSGTPRQAPPSRPDSPHEEIEEKEVLEDAAQFDDEPEEKGGGIGGAYKAAKKTLLNIQVTVGEICTMGESVQTLFTWKDPVKSAIVCGGLFALSVVVMIIPMRLAIALAGVHRFTKHLKKRWEAIKFFRSQPDGKAEGPKVDRLARRPSGNPVINFLSHVPAPWELAPDEHHLPEQLKKIS